MAAHKLRFFFNQEVPGSYISAYLHCTLYQKQVRTPKPGALGSVVKIEVGAENIHKRA